LKRFQSYDDLEFQEIRKLQILDVIGFVRRAD